MQASPIQVAFNAGEWSELMRGRVDLEFYAVSMKLAENIRLKLQGPASKRTGTKFVASTKYADRKSILVPFNFKSQTEQQSYQLEFGHNYMRVYKDRGIITETADTVTNITQANPGVVTTSASHGYTTGDEVILSGIVGMEELNGRQVTVTVLSTTTFSIGIDTTSYTAYTSGGESSEIYEIVTTFAEDQLEGIKLTQSNDIIFIAHSATDVPKTLSRLGDTNWVLADYDFVDGPYENTNADTSHTITPGTSTNTPTLVSSQAMFAATDVGRYIRVKENAGDWRVMKITTYNSATSVTAEIEDGGQFTDGTAVPDWRLGSWSGTTGYPQAVSFFQNRLFWSRELTIYGSVQGDYYNFRPTDLDGTVQDNQGVIFTLQADRGGFIKWMTDNGKSILVGTDIEEWVARANTIGESIKPTDVNADLVSRFGSQDVQGIRINNTALFVQKSGKIIGESRFSFADDAYLTENMNLFSSHLGDSYAFGRASYMPEPDNIFFTVREDGQLLGMTYMPEQKVKGWTRDITDGVIEDVSVIPSADSRRNEIWVVVKRTIGGEDIRYVEYYEDELEVDSLPEEGFYVDSGLTYDGRTYPDATLTPASNEEAEGVTFTASASVFTAGDVGKVIRFRIPANPANRTPPDFAFATITAYTSGTEVECTIDAAFQGEMESGEWTLIDQTEEITGLWHLEGKTVDVCVDGATHPRQTVANGTISLNSPAGVVHVGLNYVMKAQIQDINAGAQDGTAIGKTKRVDKIGLRLFNTVGGSVGPDEANLEELDFRDFEDRMDLATEMFTGDIIVPYNEGYSIQNAPMFYHADPLPATIVAIMPRLVTQDGR